MSITKRIVEDGIIYTKCNGIWIVGDNKTSAFSKNYIPTNALVIPKKVRGHAIKEIGTQAFREGKEIVSVFIEAELTRINNHAFSRCSCLSFINIPATVTYIDDCALYFGIDDHSITKSTVTILFDASDKEINISSRNFIYCERVIIYYCRSVAPIFHSGVFSNVFDAILYSSNFTQIFGRNATNDSTRCFSKMKFNIKHNYCTIQYLKSNNSHNFIMFFYWCIK